MDMMEWFNVIAGISSIISLLISIFVVSKVVKLSNSNNNNAGVIQTGDGVQKVAEGNSVIADEGATYISKPLKYKFTDRKDYKFNMKRKYVIWAWKGDYLNLGAGCEVGFYNTYGSTKHYFFVKKIFTELEMRYNGNLINNYRPPKSKGEKVGHSWWITTFNAGMQNNVNPSKIGFRCVADLSVLKAYARKALERRLEKSKRWNVEGNKATLKWNY